METKGNRLLALEGIRGVAAIIVALYHALFIFYAVLIAGPGTAYAPIQHMRFEDNLYGSPLSVFISGTFAVAIFFILSGFVLSIGFFQTGREQIVKKLAAKRYLRLMIPALTSVMIAWLLITLGLSQNAQAEAITASGWLAEMWSFAPNFYEALTQGSWAIFTNGQNSYNPVLWTMLYEFVGSFLIFMTLLLFGKLSKRWIIYAVLLILTIQTWYLGFVLGMILADCYASKKFPFNISRGRLPLLLIGVGLVLGGFPGGITSGTFYQTLSIPGFDASRSLFLCVGAAMVIIGIVTQPSINRFFSSRRISGLGRYTFSLYLTHKLVLFTLCTGLFIWLHTFLGYNIAAILSIIATIPVIVLASYLFEKYVDAPSIRLSGVFANWLLGLPRQTETAAYAPAPKMQIMSRMKQVYSFIGGGVRRRNSRTATSQPEVVEA